MTKLSPYTSSIDSKNYLYTDFEKFVTDEYANILTVNDNNDDIKNAIRQVDKEGVYEASSDQTNFNKAFYVVDKLYEKAYKNLMLKVENKDPSALKL